MTGLGETCARVCIDPRSQAELRVQPGNPILRPGFRSITVAGGIHVPVPREDSDLAPGLRVPDFRHGIAFCVGQPTRNDRRLFETLSGHGQAKVDAIPP